MRRPLLVLALVLAGLARPAGAIETETFGIEATRESDGRHLRTVVRPGDEATERLLVWNKTEDVLRLDIRVVSARIPRRGAPELGGNDPAVEWVSVEPETVTLDGDRQRVITVTMDPPADVPRRSAVAVLATPRTSGAVLQRLGIVIDLRRGTPVEDDGDGGLVLWIVLVAAAALTGAVALYVRVARRAPTSLPR